MFFFLWSKHVILIKLQIAVTYFTLKYTFPTIINKNMIQTNLSLDISLFQQKSWLS